jgi:hypothetical protein
MDYSEPLDSFSEEFRTGNSLQLEQHKLLLGSIEDFAKEFGDAQDENDAEINRLRSSLSIQLVSHTSREKETNSTAHDSRNFTNDHPCFGRPENLYMSEPQEQPDQPSTKNLCSRIEA